MPSTLQSCRPTERSFSHREASRQARSRHFMRFFNTPTACRANSPRDPAKGGDSPVRSPLERRRVDETSRRPPIRQSSRSVPNGEDVSPSLIPRLKLSARRFRVAVVRTALLRKLKDVFRRPRIVDVNSDATASITQARLWDRVQRYLRSGDIVVADQGTSSFGIGTKRLHRPQRTPASGGVLPLRGDRWTAGLLDVHRRSAMSALRQLRPFVRLAQVALEAAERPHTVCKGNRGAVQESRGEAADHRGHFAFHSRAIRCASAIWAAVILAATSLRINLLPLRKRTFCAPR